MPSSPHRNRIPFPGLCGPPFLMSILFSATILYPLIVKGLRIPGNRRCSVLGSLKLVASQALPPVSLTVRAGVSSGQAQPVLPWPRTGLAWLPTPKTFTQAAPQILELERKDQWDTSKPPDVTGTPHPTAPPIQRTPVMCWPPHSCHMLKNLWGFLLLIRARFVFALL